MERTGMQSIALSVRLTAAR